jgi:hypothetical protein
LKWGTDALFPYVSGEREKENRRENSRPKRNEGEAFVKKMETLLSRSFITLPSGRPRIKKSAEEAADLFPEE